MKNDLLLLSGEDIPFLGARTVIHQPKLKEIALIGEMSFFVGSQFLMFNKNYLADQDKTSLENKSNFEIFMAIMNSGEHFENKEKALLLLSLLFPQYDILLERNKIVLQSRENEEERTFIEEENFEEFQEIINNMFILNSDDNKKAYDPADALAKKIAEKIQKGKQKAAGKKNVDTEDIHIFDRYISILSVGLQKNVNDLVNYTVYQIKTEFKRYQLKLSSDIYLKAKLAGAENLEEVEDWMGEIHP